MKRNQFTPVLAIFHREFDRFVTKNEVRVSDCTATNLARVFAAGFRSVLGIAIQPPYETYITYDLYVTPGLVGMIALFNGMRYPLAWSMTGRREV